MKHCACCGHDKPLASFYRDTSKRDGRSSYCRDCCKEKARKRYAEFKSVIREKQRMYRATHGKQIRRQKRRWRQANLEHARRKSRQWTRDNPDRCRENHAEWRKDNRGRIRDYDRRWRDLNRDSYSAYQKAYRKRNPQAALNAASRRRARLAEFAAITKQEWRALMSEYGWRCFYCDRVLVRALRTMDHLIPLSRGGRHHVANLMPCCRACNREKNAIVYPVWRGLEDLNEEKSAHLVSRLAHEMRECGFQVPADACLNQLLLTIDKLLAR